MKTINSIPTSKIERAGKILQTGLKIGVNYLKYGVDKVVDKDNARDNLNEANASDIYDGLKDLKGSALKVAQMLSMEKSIMPQQYIDKFSLSQFSVPPLSAPLVLKTFKQSFGKFPEQLFDKFNTNAVNAASIGQVHRAEKDGLQLAVKIQYPGVANAISSDLAMIKPIAMKMFNIQGEGSSKYFKEVEDKLIEETNYELELKQSIEFAEACKNMPNMIFPKYYAEYSSAKILTMDWMEGKHLSEINFKILPQKIKNELGQALWDYYMFQIRVLRKVNADPHPGNFLLSDDFKLISIDFGCIKHIPESFYIPYFELIDSSKLQNKKLFESKLYELEILKESDTKEEKKYFLSMFHELISLFTLPFHNENFDFSDDVFFEKIINLGERYAKDSQLRKFNANRGSKHFIYMNRTFYGLYNLMHEIGAKKVMIDNYIKFV